jgi:AbrB family looped-hinge helix DNA binding protein
MAYSSVLSSRGRITVPQEIRIRLGLREGDRVEFVVERGYTIMRPARSDTNPFAVFAGALEGAFPGGIREINAWVDEMRWNKRSRR